MTPIDDELRAALQGRASALAPSPDPLAGIERRAKRIQRTRLGAAVAASALAVTAIAAAVPTLQDATSSGPDVPRVATAPASPTPRTSPYVLDPDAPWAYRGDDLSLLGPGTLATIETELGTKRGASDVELTPLWGQVYEPSQQFTLVYLAEVDGELRWGVSQTPTESGPEFLVDEELPDPAYALAAALPGDEGARLVVVADPEVAGISYSADGTDAALSAMQAVAPGVAVVHLGAGSPTDVVVVIDRDGREVHRADAPDPTAVPVEPVTVLDPEMPWEVRGDPSLVTDGQLEALGEDWATRNGIDALVEIRPLFVQRWEVDAGIEVVYLVRSGDGPWTWGVASLGEGGWWWYAENEITDPLSALVATLPGDEGAQRLLVVGAPSTGGAMRAEGGGDFEPMADLAPGVFVTTVAPGAEGYWKLLDGDGDLDRPVAEGDVPPFQNAG